MSRRNRVFRIEVTLAATCYVHARNATEARKLAAEYVGGDAPEVDGSQFDSPDLPTISLSPAMTLQSLDSEPERCDP